MRWESTRIEDGKATNACQAALYKARFSLRFKPYLQSKAGSNKVAWAKKLS